MHSLTINGHNNQLILGREAKIPIVLINGHNNFSFSKETGNSSLGLIERLVVQGHNNKIESIRTGKIELFGHNNQITGVGYYQGVSDTGQNNRIRDCVRLH